MASLIEGLWSTVTNAFGKKKSIFTDPDWLPLSTQANMTGERTFSSASQTITKDNSREGGVTVIEHGQVVAGYVYPADANKKDHQRGITAIATGQRETQKGIVVFEMSSAQIRGEGMGFNGDARATSGTQPAPKEVKKKSRFSRS